LELYPRVWIWAESFVIVLEKSWWTWEKCIEWISTQEHQVFFDAVAAADQREPFSALLPATAMARVAQISLQHNSCISLHTTCVSLLRSEWKRLL